VSIALKPPLCGEMPNTAVAIKALATVHKCILVGLNAHSKI